MATAVAIPAGALKFENRTDEELLESFKPPVFSIPYPLNVNPKYSSSKYKEMIAQWTTQEHKVDTVFTPKMYQLLLNMDIPSFGGHIFTEAPEEGLWWSIKFLFMLWVWDETMDSTDVGLSPETALSPLMEAQLPLLWSFPDDPILRETFEHFLNQLEGQARPEKVAYIESVLAEARTQPGTVYPKPMSTVMNGVYFEFWADVVAKASPEYCVRLARANQLWFLGILQETENRKKGDHCMSSIDEYIQLRRRTSALPSVVGIADFVYGLNTSPDSWFYSHEHQSVVDAINDVISWHNDLWSFKKEVLLAKEPYNMVLHVSVHRKVSYTEAAAITMQMVKDRISDLERSGKELESITPPECRRNFEVLMLTGRNIISGGEDWYSHNMHYNI